MFEKIKLKLDKQFFKDTSNPEIVKKLSKKLQILQNSYDGVIQLDSANYKYQCYLKWIFEDTFWR